MDHIESRSIPLNKYEREGSRYTYLAPINEEHEVYLVRNEDTGIICVKKTLRTYNMDVYKRVSGANIRGIPKIYEMSEKDDVLTVIEEYIPGRTVYDMINSAGSIPEDTVRDIAVKLCDILIALHRLNPPVIHRDIKPSNVIITTEGSVYLLDLNAAKLEDANKGEDTVMLGTYGYAAPEQFGFGSSTVQTDIYAIGMLMNTMLLGEYSKDVADKTVIAKVIRKCLMLKPEERYSSVKDLRAAIISPFTNGYGQYAIPGFRSQNPFHMITAIAGYLLIFSLALTLETKNQDSIYITWYERIGCLLIMLAAVFFLSDYMGIKKRIPVCNSNKPVKRILWSLLMTYFLVMCLFCVMVAIEVLLVASIGR